MNYQELSHKIAAEHGLTKTKGEEIVKNIFETIKDEMATEGEVVIRGFGRFTSRKAAARTGRVVRTGEAVEIPARTVPKFVAHSSLKAAIQ